jgi:site-specific DNA recombinase
MKGLINVMHAKSSGGTRGRPASSNGHAPARRGHRVAIYVRVSGAEQKRKETSKPQLALLAAMAEGRAHPDIPEADRVLVVDRVVDEGQSGTLPLTEREQGSRLVALIESGAIDEIWITKLDRIARNLRLLLEIHDFLDAHGVSLVAVNDSCDTSTPTGRLIFHILGSIAEWERERIDERMSEGRNAKVAEGRSNGGAPPFGYRLDEQKRFARDETFIPQAGMTAWELVRWMYLRIGDEAATAEQVAEQLTSWGVPLTLRHYTIDPSKRGRGVNRRPDGRWIGARVLSLLHKPHFKGQGVMNLWQSGTGKDARGRRLRRKGMVASTVEFSVPPIVDEDLWDRTRRQITLNQKRSKRNAKRTYMLSGGVMKCGTVRDGEVCGRNYTGLQNRWGTPYYRGMATKSYYGTCHCARTVPAVEIEEKVWGKIVEVMRNPGPYLAESQARLDARRADGPALDGRLQALGARLHELEGERERTMMLFRKGRIDEARLDHDLDEIVVQIGDVQRERELLLSQQSVTDALEARLARAGSVYVRYRERIEEIDRSGDPDAKQALVRELGAEVTMTYWTDEQGQLNRKPTLRLDLGPIMEIDLATSSRS